MLKDITLGQYYRGDSILHRLDPRVKIIGTLLYIILIFAAGGPAGYIASAVFLLIMIAISRVPVSFMIRGMRAVAFILVFTSVFNLFLTPGEVLWSYGFLQITDKGIITCVSMVVRMCLLIIGSSLMTLTTTPNALTDAIEALLGFLRVFRVPVHEMAMMMSIALRFIPILMEETDKIMKAQKARGADFETGGLVKKAKALVPIMVPLFVSAFRRANDLAMAMEARCYSGSAGRTRMKPLRYKRIDIFAFIVLLLYLLLMIAIALTIK